jgi:hypothetical protein
MKRLIRIASIVFISLWLLAALLCAEEKNEPEQIATSPSGRFHLVRLTEEDEFGGKGGQRLVLVPTNDAKTRIALPVEGKLDAKTVVELAFIAPDEHWILSKDTFCSARLYRQTGDLQYGLAEPECLDQLAWHFFAEQEKVDEKLIGLPSGDGPPGQRSLRFVDWSRDSARLLIGLDATIGLPDKESANFKAGIASWLCYFNTKTGTFEITHRLREANRGARKRWRSYDAPPADLTLPLSAESLGQEGPWAPPTKRFERADKRLNTLYATHLKQLPLSAREQFRQEEREWLIRRDTDAAIYATQRWSPFAAAALIEGQAIATEARIAELEKRLEP